MYTCILCLYFLSLAGYIPHYSYTSGKVKGNVGIYHKKEGKNKKMLS